MYALRAMQMRAFPFLDLVVMAFWWLAILPILLVLCKFILDRKAFAVPSQGIILVTGASSGIGRHAAEYFATHHKEFVVLAGVRKESDAKLLIDLKQSNLRPILIDVAVNESRSAAFEEIKKIMVDEKLPFIALVNNAGISRMLPAEFHDMDDARKIFDTNLFGLMATTQLALPLLRHSNGRIIMVSSVAGFVSAPLSSVYCASKRAVEALSDGLRREVAHFGISVSVIQPAYVKTPIFNSLLDASAELAKKTDKQEEMHKLYSLFYSESAESKRAAEMAGASDPTVTSTAIEDAILSKHPKTRYAVAHAGGLPASVIAWTNWLMSDRIADFFMDFMLN